MVHAQPLLFRILVAATAALSFLPIAPAASAAGGPGTTPTSAVRFYQQSVNHGMCAQAYKLIALSAPRPPMEQFLKQCAATKHVAVNPILDPGYRITHLNAAYTCLGVRFTIVYRSGTVQSSGGWLLLEKTPDVFWHMLLSRSHLTANGQAGAPSETSCTSAIPSYAQPGSAQLIIGSAFLTSSTGWIAVGRSGAYVPNGSCSHGLGSNCNTAQTVIYGTTDAGAHWRALLTLTASAGPLLWIRLFNRNTGLIAAAVGPRDRGMLFATSDGGRTWRRSPLPAHYLPVAPTITFPDPQHGWVYIGDGAMGSMGVTVFATADGGRHWSKVACTQVAGYQKLCPSDSGIGFGGDKTFLTFTDNRSGWLTIASNTGIPSLLHSTDGGHTWRDQGVSLPPGLSPLNRPNQTFAYGTLGQPYVFGRSGILAEVVSFFQSKPHAAWSRLYIYRSEDAGSTWNLAQLTPVPGLTNGPYELGAGPVPQFLDAQDWLAISGATIWRTANAGAAWSHIAMRLPAGLQLLSFSFTDPRHGWAEAAPLHEDGGVLGSTTLLRTNDGGGRWLRVSVP
jgi:photosystem II stability/assembly factor-like uncharacterized protein